MGSGGSVPLDKRIVIVGGGYAGMDLAARLMKDGANFTLIDATDSFWHNVCAVRAVVDKGITEKMYIDYATTFKGHFKQGQVIGVNTEAKEVLLSGGETVRYDILILAVGCSGEFPAKLWEPSRDEAVKKYLDYADRVKSSQNIAIVGGGAVGVEIASEIMTDLPEKTVTLVHPNHDLLRSGLSDKMKSKLRGILDRFGVKLRLGEKVSNLDDLDLESAGPFTLQLSGGDSLEADLVIKCTGGRPNTAAYKSGLESSMDERGALLVDKHLQVEGQDGIFALGDCTNVAEMKLAVTAHFHAEHMYNNLKLLASQQQLKPYKPDSQPFKIVISMGRNSGIGELKLGPILPEFVVMRLKSRDMFMDRYWGMMQQKTPQ